MNKSCSCGFEQLLNLSKMTLADLHNTREVILEKVNEEQVKNQEERTVLKYYNGQMITPKNKSR